MYVDPLILTVIVAVAVLAVIGTHLFTKLFTLQRQSTQVSHFAFMAAFAAYASSEGVKKSAVINRIVERYHVVHDKSANMEEERQKLEDELNDLIDPDGLGLRTERDRRVRETLNPDDLV